MGGNRESSSIMSVNKIHSQNDFNLGNVILDNSKLTKKKDECRSSSYTYFKEKR